MSAPRKLVLVVLVWASWGAAHAAGTVTGTVVFAGPRPQQEVRRYRSDPFCAKYPFPDEDIVVGPDGKTLQNVVIRVLDTPSPALPPSKPALIYQDRCVFRPHVQVALAGQKIRIVNRDSTLHNVRGYQGARALFNQATPVKAALEKDMKLEGVMKITCDIHPWMQGYVVFAKAPHFAVTDQNGRFKIRGVPSGKHVVEAWHESLGTQTTEITVEEGKSTSIHLMFDAPAAKPETGGPGPLKP